MIGRCPSPGGLLVRSLLRHRCGDDWPDAVEVTRHIHRRKSCDVAVLPTQAQAEDLAVVSRNVGSPRDGAVPVTGDEGWYDDVTPDFFDAVVVAGGVAVRMTPNVAVTLHHHVDLLARVPDGEAGDDRLLRRMFPGRPHRPCGLGGLPDAARGAARDSAGPCRVRDQLALAPHHVPSPAEVDDWLVTFALARFAARPAAGASVPGRGTT